MGSESSLILALGLWCSSLFASSQAVSSAALLISAADQKVICNAIVYGPQDVLVPLHCLDSLDPKEVRVRAFPDGQPREVTKIRSIVDREGYFPSYDLAMLSISKPWPAFKAVKKRMDAPRDGTYVLETIRASSQQPLRIPLKLLKKIEGSRVTPLLLMEVQGRELPCFGDSGGAVYLESKNGREFVGFLTGLFYPLTPSSYRCEDRKQLVTPIAPYLSWMESGKVPFSKAGRTTYPSLEAACQDQDFFSESWTDLQDLILSLFPPEKLKLDLDSSARMLLDCKGVDRLWSKSSDKVLKFKGIPSAQEFPFLSQVKKASFQGVQQDDLAKLPSWTGLEEVVFNGTQDAIDFSNLTMNGSVRILSLQHSQNFKGLAKAVTDLKQLNTLHLYHAKPGNPSEVNVIRQTLPHVKLTVDQLQNRH